MRTLYIDCGMGAAGDMLMAALYELCEDKEGFLAKMNALGLPGVRVEAEPAVKCGITGTQMSVFIDGEEEDSVDRNMELYGLGHDHEHEHHEYDLHHDDHHHDDSDCTVPHHHTGMQEIEQYVARMQLPDEVKENVLAVYRRIAEAESQVHGRPIDQIHFHEVGSLDAIADVTGVCLLMQELKTDRVIVSPVHVGSGQVRCAHGILPVPAPATAYLLREVPIYNGQILGELCTPTGAALLTHFATSFGPMPVMRVSKIGYGCGKKDFEAANCVRMCLGETEEQVGQIVELCCNLDDMTPEEVGFAQEILFANGALDVYTTAIGMKKCRPGVMLTCMCRINQVDTMKKLLFLHTTTLGIREYLCNRTTLTRTMHTVETEYGPVRYKEAAGWGVTRGKYEYEDLARIAKERGTSIAEVRKNIRDGSSVSKTVPLY